MTPELLIEHLDVAAGKLQVTISGVMVRDGSTRSIFCSIPAAARTVTVGYTGLVSAWTLAPAEMKPDPDNGWGPVADGIHYHDIWLETEGSGWIRKKVANFTDLIFEMPVDESGTPMALRVSAEWGKAIGPTRKKLRRVSNE